MTSKSHLLNLLKPALSGTAALSLCASLQAQSSLAPGDVIKVDFSSMVGPVTSGPLSDWNLLSDNQTISAGSVMLSGSATPVSGVSVSVNGNGSNMDGNTANWPGFGSDPYYIPAADGLVYSVNPGLGILGDPYELDATFSGLNPNYVYNVFVYRLINEPLANFDAGVTDGNHTDIHYNINREQVFSESTLDPRLIFDGVQANVSDQIIVSTGSAQATGMEAVVLQVAAVPEPSKLALALLGGASLMLFRRRR